MIIIHPKGGLEDFVLFCFIEKIKSSRRMERLLPFSGICVSAIPAHKGELHEQHFFKKVNIGEAGRRIYGNTLYYLFKFSVSPTLFENRKLKFFFKLHRRRRGKSRGC